MADIMTNIVLIKIFGSVLWELEQRAEPPTRQVLLDHVKQHALRVSSADGHQNPARLSKDIRIALTEYLSYLDEMNQPLGRPQ